MYRKNLLGKGLAGRMFSRFMIVLLAAMLMIPPFSACSKEAPLSSSGEFARTSKTVRTLVFTERDSPSILRPNTKWKRCFYAVDELTGLIGAVALSCPSEKCLRS